MLKAEGQYTNLYLFSFRKLSANNIDMRVSMMSMIDDIFHMGSQLGILSNESLTFPNPPYFLQSAAL